MNRYNLTVKILVNVAVNASSPHAAKQVIEKKLEIRSVLTNMPEFVIKDADITGVFDTDWVKIELNDLLYLCDRGYGLEDPEVADDGIDAIAKLSK